ncbi:MAG: phytanoyl-CoA dioxygenase family protein [Alphaproteobacteria bacterium]|nr:phytanoyl-CoA dioxygenase family protein [Alphaproteobacteria bacterium]
MIPARFRPPVDGRPGAAMREAFARDGFLIVEGFASAAECEALVRRAERLIETLDRPRAVFDTKRQSHADDAWFRESGDKVRLFAEIDGQNVNKIGHALHLLDPEFAAFSSETRWMRYAAALGLARPLAIQSMVIVKGPRIGGEVDWHQDATFLSTEPSSVIGLWLALEDADRSNGCMRAIPGAHRGPLRRRFRRAGDRLTMEETSDRPWPDTAAIELEAPRGTLIALHGHLPHMSPTNVSNRRRLAYALHLVDEQAHYREDNWLPYPGRAARGEGIG